jgi:hypothetical protein
MSDFTVTLPIITTTKKPATKNSVAGKLARTERSAEMGQSARLVLLHLDEEEQKKPRSKNASVAVAIQEKGKLNPQGSRYVLATWT